MIRVANFIKTRLLCLFSRQWYSTCMYFPIVIKPLIYVSIFFQLTCDISFAQTYFQYRYGSPVKDERQSKGVIHKNMLYVCTQSNDANYYKSGIKILKTDSSLNIVQQKEIIAPGFIRIKGMFAVTDSTLLITAHSIDTLNFNGVQSTVLIYLNESCDTLWTTSLHKFNEDVVLNYVHSTGDTILLHGAIGSYQNENTSPAFVKINMTNGLILSTEKIEFDGANTFKLGLSCIFHKKDSCYYAAGITFDTTSFSFITYLLKLSTGLFPVNLIYLNDSSKTTVNISSKENNIILCYAKFDSIGSSAVISEYDTSFNNIWTKQYFNCLFDNVEYMPYDSILVLANGGLLVNIDHQGQPISQKKVVYFLQQQGSQTTISDLFPFSSQRLITLSESRQQINLPYDLTINRTAIDGSGCIDQSFNLSMNPANFSHQQIQAFKSNLNIFQTYGLPLTDDSLTFQQDCLTAQYVVNEVTPVHLKVFPNPTVDNVNFIVENKTITSLTIYNNLGQIVHTHSFAQETIKVQIDIRKLEPGIYFANLIMDGDIHNAHRIKLVKL
jgi:hypothetical protein